MSFAYGGKAAASDSELVGIADTVTDATNLNAAGGVCVRGLYVYVSVPGDNQISRFDIRDLSATPTTVKSGIHLNGVTSITADDAGTYGYACASGRHRICKINLGDMTVNDSVRDATYLNACTGIVQDGTYAYTASPTVGYFCRIPIDEVDDFDNSTDVITDTDLANATAVALSDDDTYAFVVTSDAKLLMFNLSTWAKVGSTVTKTTEFGGALGVAEASDVVYVTSKGNNSIAKVTYTGSGMTYSSVTQDNTELNEASGIIIPGSTHSGDYAYVACDAGDRVTQIKLSDVSVVTSVGDSTWLNGAKYLAADAGGSVYRDYAAVICPANDYLTLVGYID
jgi:hypothetical protein